MDLRGYQKNAIQKFNEARSLGKANRFLMTLATGAGKTVIASKLMSDEVRLLYGRCLFIVHRDELIQQTVKKLRQVDETLRVGVIKAERDEWGEHYDVSVASVQTISRRLSRYPRDFFSLIVVDETHRATAATYRKTLEHFNVFKKQKPPTLLGITATAKRSDGDTLDSIFQEVVYDIGIEALIRDGWLVPIKALAVQTETDLSGVKKTAGDFNERELADLLNVENRNDKIAEAMQTYAAGRKSVVFCVTVQHAQDLATTLNRHGIRAECVHGETPIAERQVIYERFRTGELDALTSVALLIEGWDEASVDSVVWATKTMSEIKFAQGIGRGTRLSPETGKRDLLVIDCADNAGRHSKTLQSVPKLFGIATEAGAQALAAGKDVFEAKAIDAEEQRQQAEQKAKQDAEKAKGRGVHAFAVNLFEKDAELPPELASYQHKWFALGQDRFFMPMVKRQIHIFRDGLSDVWHADIHVEQDYIWRRERRLVTDKLPTIIGYVLAYIDRYETKNLAGLRTMKMKPASPGQLRLCGGQKPNNSYEACLIIAVKKARQKYMQRDRVA